MRDWRRQILIGVVGGAFSVVMTLWLRFYVPSTDSFADIRDAPAIFLAFFVGPLPALIAGTLSAVGRATIGLFGGIGSATWFGSSLASFVAALVAVAARRFVFFGERPSFALGAAVAAIVEMAHMAVVLTVGSAEFANAFAVTLAAIPFQCGGVATLVALASLALNRRQNGRENLIVSALAVSLVTCVILAYFAMERQAMAVAEGRLPLTDVLYRYPCNLATMLYGIVLSALAFAFAVYAKRKVVLRKDAEQAGDGRAVRYTVGIRGRFAISLVAMLGVVGGLVGLFVSVEIRSQYERSCSDSAVAVAQFMANSIDGERVLRYHATGCKDAHYEDVRKMLLHVRDMTDICYLNVFIPDERGATYVWCTGTSPDGVPDDLGTREEHLEPEELRICGEVMRQKIDKCCFIHRSGAYGHLMSALVPILGTDGKPVALASVDLQMDSIDGRISVVVFGVALVTLALVLLCLAGYYFFVSRFIVSPAEQEIMAEKGRIHAELNVARKIQADALPSVFPAFPDRREFDVYAMMVPAKEVGGDFYDFFLVDETHLALVIGDVSDKGVPAALFMMTTKSLIKARTCQGGTPAEILRDVNDRLCEGNCSGMFVTMYLAIIDLKTGQSLSANAGHEHPILRRAGGDFMHVRYRHNPMLGAMPGLVYVDRAFELHPGDTLLVYTDGVTECADVQKDFYGMERITAFLNRQRNLTLEPLLKGLRADLAAFAGTAPQSDDITLLAVTYMG